MLAVNQKLTYQKYSEFVDNKEITIGYSFNKANL